MLTRSDSPMAVITPMVCPRRSTPRAWPAPSTAAALETCSPLNRPMLAGSPAGFTVAPPARPGGTHRPLLVLSGAPPTTSTGTRKASNSTAAAARTQGAAEVRDRAGPGASRRATAQSPARVVDLPRRGGLCPAGAHPRRWRKPDRPPGEPTGGHHGGQPGGLPGHCPARLSRRLRGQHARAARVLYLLARPVPALDALGGVPSGRPAGQHRRHRATPRWWSPAPASSRGREREPRWLRRDHADRRRLS